MFNKLKVQFCQLHKSQVCIGFCVQINCPSSSIYCQKCLEEDHGDHLDGCKEFEEINKDLLNSIRKKKNHLDKVKEKYIQLNQLSIYQIDSYEKQIDDLRNIQRNFRNKKFNSLQIKQIKILKDQSALDQELDDENKLNQIEQLIQSLEFIKKDFLANSQQKFTKYLIQNLYKVGSLCSIFFQIIIWIMYIYLFLLGAMVILLIYVENDDLEQSKQRQFRINFHNINNQIQYFNQANDLYHMQNYKEAINYYNRVISLRKNQTLTYLYQGNDLSKLQHFEEGVINYNETLMNSQSDVIYLNKGYALFELKRFNEAIECYDRAIQINFYNDEAYYNKGNLSNNSIMKILGRALHQLEHYFEAVESYNKAINIKSNNQHYYNSKGLALNNLKEYNEAIKSYDSALQNSINHEILVNKANSLANLGKLERAKEFNE